jgi:transcriptional regulator with XRE-family HTH domain
MSKFLKAAQEAIRSSGMTHEQLAKEVGTERQRISELMNKDDLRGTVILEKVLSYLKKEDFENLVKNKLTNV